MASHSLCWILASGAVVTRLYCSSVCSSFRSTIVVLFFFFQAEDGIRDKLVTGVQTCALPILLKACFDDSGTHASSPISTVGGYLAHIDAWEGFQIRWSTLVGSLKELGGFLHMADYGRAHHPTRSEERRVGKECRSRWSPYH